jgi:hypothetical protein
MKNHWLLFVKINKISPIHEKVSADKSIFLVEKSSFKYTYINNNGIKKGFKQSEKVSKRIEIRNKLKVAIIKKPFKKISFFIN